MLLYHHLTTEEQEQVDELQYTILQVLLAVSIKQGAVIVHMEVDQEQFSLKIPPEAKPSFNWTMGIIQS